MFTYGQEVGRPANTAGGFRYAGPLTVVAVSPERVRTSDGCEWTHDGTSLHYPGSAMRIVAWEPWMGQENEMRDRLYLATRDLVELAARGERLSGFRETPAKELGRLVAFFEGLAAVAASHMDLPPSGLAYRDRLSDFYKSVTAGATRDKEGDHPEPCAPDPPAPA
jgi:hypothetical protein